MVRPLVATRITANHLTAARLIVGLAACLALATGLRTWELWGGFLWVLSAFLDRADGELARLSGKTSITGHRFDFLSDVIVNGIVFVAIGVGQREGILGIHAITLGIIAGTSIVLACIWSERLEQLNDNREKAYAGWRGFDFDDVLYLFGPIAWLGWLLPLLIGAVVGGTAIASITWIRMTIAARSNTGKSSTEY